MDRLGFLQLGKMNLKKYVYYFFQSIKYQTYSNYVANVIQFFIIIINKWLTININYEEFF